MLSGKVNVLIDSQWGSTGKGKLAGILALKHNPQLAVCNFMTNAGHTWVPDDGGDPVMVQQIPSCLINPRTLLHIAATAAIDLKVFDGEMSRFDARYGVKDRLTVDPRAGIITTDNKETEAASLHRVSSTVKGCGAATAEKIMRQAVLAKFYNGKFRTRETEDIVQVGLKANWKILFEMAQGYDLSLNHGTRYPYCTSRDIMVCQALSDACAPPSAIGHVYASLRAFPIRVGNAFEVTGGDLNNQNGWSGPYYPDQKELSWDEMTAMSNSHIPLLEHTTVTHKIRRIFTFSHLQLDRFIRANDPTYLFINFVNYIDAGAYGLTVKPEHVQDFYRAFPNIKYFVKKIEEHGVPIAYLGTGPKHSHLVDLGIDN